MQPTRQRPPRFYGGADKNARRREAAKPRILGKVAHQYNPAKNQSQFHQAEVGRGPAP